jgi:uncharacterized protein YbaP (TraB family)
LRSSSLAVLRIAAFLIVLAPIAVSAGEALDEVQVIEQPGPRMWRISKDDHQLWIIGTVSPSPLDLQWNSKQVQVVMKEADELLIPANYGIMFAGNPFTVMRYVPQLMKLRNNPDGAQLRDLLPPEQFERWKKLYSEAYGKPPGDDQRWRPMLLADTLYDQTLDSRNLTRSDLVWPRLNALAKESSVPTHRREFPVALGGKHIKPLLTEFREFPRDVEIKCLIATMDHIEQQVPLIEGQATDWAVGDPGLLESDLAWANRRECSLEAVLQSSLQENLQAQAELGKEYWRGIVSYALLSRKTTVTAIPIRELTGTDGLFDYLRASGYLIESPR